MLLIRIDGKPEELESLVSKLEEEKMKLGLDTTTPVQIQTEDGLFTSKVSSLQKKDIIFKSRPRYKNFSAQFLEPCLTYGSTAELSIELRVHKLISNYQTKLSLFFNHDIYNQIAIDVDIG